MRFQRAGSLAACLVLTGGALCAQESRAPVGVQIGYSRADLGGQKGVRLASRQGALAGVYLTGQLWPALAIQPELLFALKGGRTDVEGDNTAEPLDIELAYLELPVLFKLSVKPKYRQIHPVLFGGMAPAIRIGCELEPIGPAPNAAACDAIEGSLRRLDLGAVVGAGLHLDWRETALGLEARYTIGLPSVFTDGTDVRNRQLGILLALNF